MKKLKLYTLVDKNKIIGKSIIRSRWVFNVKQEIDNIKRFKASLVAKGFTQEPGRNYLDTFSPVISMDSIRFLFRSVPLIDGISIKWMPKLLF